MLEEKIETLTKEVVALRQAIEKSGLGGTAASGGKASTAKKKVVEPEHDADETGAIFRKAAKEDKPACRAYLKKKGCADLAELLTKPELYDGAYEFAEKLIEEAGSADEDDDDV